jgi:dTDP-4-dehydrorhamnose reductase
MRCSAAPSLYESGAFDVRGGARRETAVARVIVDLAARRTPNHPVLDVPGWWKRTPGPLPAASKPVLIAGGGGTLGRAFVRACESRGIAHVALSRTEMDITAPDAVRAAVARCKPWAVINAAGYVRVDEAERERTACRRANAVGPAVLAAVCRQRGVQLVTFSSDLVFDGAAQRPYLESDSIRPLNDSGRTKAEAERRVLALAPSALVIRTSAFFGPWDRANFVTQVLEALARGTTVRAASDAIVSPTYVPDLVGRALDLLIDGAAGVWHVANSGALTWNAFARMAASAARFDPDGVECRRVRLRAYWPLARSIARLVPSAGLRFRRSRNRCRGTCASEPSGRQRSRAAGSALSCSVWGEGFSRAFSPRCHGLARRKLRATRF